VRGAFQIGLHGLVERLRQADGLAVQCAFQHLGALGRDRTEQLVEGFGELLHAVLDQRFSDVVQVQAHTRDIGDQVAGLIDSLGERRVDVAVVAERVERLRRHGVDGIGTDQAFDVQHIGIGRILGPRGRPQQALRRGAGVGQGLPAGRVDHLQILLIGELGVGDGHLAAKPGQSLLGVPRRQLPIDLLVDHPIDAADEETGHAVYPGDVSAGLVQVLQTRNVRVGHRQIGVDAEQQGHVDVDPLADQRPDGMHPRLGPRHLDHKVGTVHRPPQAARFGDRRVGVHRQIGRNLQADEAILATQGVERRAEGLRRAPDVGDRHVLVEVDDLAILRAQQRRDPHVVDVALADRLLEDGRIGGESGDAVLGDHPLEFAVVENLRMQIVQPDRLAGVAESAQ